MAFTPVRFLHVSGLRLDCPLQGVDDVAPENRSIIQRATLLTAENLVSTCLEQQVDFLLLTGNTFREADHSLQARLAIERLFDELASLQIRVFVVPGTQDPIWAWQGITSLPECVTVFYAEDNEPVAVFNEHRTVVATVRTIGSGGAELDAIRHTSHRAASSETGSRNAPLSVGAIRADHFQEHLEMCQRAADSADEGHECQAEFDLDYLAVWNGAEEMTAEMQLGIARCAGPAQAMSPQSIGPRGGTLVEVDQSGNIDITFLPLAAVRFEKCELEIDPAMDYDDIALTMQLHLEEHTIEAGEQLWWINWVLSGDNDLLKQLRDSATRERLLQNLPALHPNDAAVKLEHRIAVSSALRADPQNECHLTVDPGSALSSLDQRFQQAWEDAAKVSIDELIGWCAEQIPDERLAEQLHAMGVQFDMAKIRRQTRQSGRALLGSSSKEKFPA